MLTFVLVCNVALSNAAIRGPYLVSDTSNTPPEGFGRVVVPMDPSLNATKYVRLKALDGTGAEYTIMSNIPNAIPYAHYLTLGKYRIIEAPRDCRVMMNGRQVTVGSDIEVLSGSYLGFYKFL